MLASELIYAASSIWNSENSSSSPRVLFMWTLRYPPALAQEERDDRAPDEHSDEHRIGL
jgi:hypothetical protein